MFQLKKVLNANIRDELESVGFDNSYIDCASSKYNYVNIKIFNLTLPQTNILKQTSLSVGADCAVHKDILTADIKTSDCILGGSISQLRNIIKKLEVQSFSMKVLAKQLDSIISYKKITVPKIVGILNLTTNSFSDGGCFYKFEDAVSHLNKLIDEGADIIDIGAESTKPYSSAVPADEQLERIKPILNYINKNNISVPISIDTRSSIVAKCAIDMGASIINDVSGFDYDKNMVNVCADSKVKVIIQHSQGTPENMQDAPTYEHLIDDIYKNLYSKIEYSKCNGVLQDNIIIDLGIGFGKTREQNFQLLNRVNEFESLNCEIMLGLSRKSLLNMQDNSNEEKDIYTLVLNTLALERKVDYLRVHNVAMNRKLVDLYTDYDKSLME